MEIWANYVASVFFACVAMLILGFYAISVNDLEALRVVAFAAGAAWLSCYLAAFYFAKPMKCIYVGALCMTVLSAVLVLIVLIGL